MQSRGCGSLCFSLKKKQIKEEVKTKKERKGRPYDSVSCYYCFLFLFLFFFQLSTTLA
jgi:hypothetical protein